MGNNLYGFRTQDLATGIRQSKKKYFLYFYVKNGIIIYKDKKGLIRIFKYFKKRKLKREIKEIEEIISIIINEKYVFVGWGKYKIPTQNTGAEFSILLEIELEKRLNELEAI